jgi:tetratricopeptide (TPR) repeat protein
VRSPKEAVETAIHVLRDLRNNTTFPRKRQVTIPELQGLERLFRNTSTDEPMRPQLERRLAEGYVELETSMLSEMAALSETAAPDATKIHDAARRSAIAYYTRLINEYPDYPKRDEVLYFLGYEYEQSQAYSNARGAYAELIAKTPKSAYAAIARFGLGEMLSQEAPSDSSKWDQAAAFYSEVAKSPSPANTLSGYAYYRLGQVFAAQGNVQRSLGEFKKVLAYSKRFPNAPYVAMLTAAASDAMTPSASDR